MFMQRVLFSILLPVLLSGFSLTGCVSPRLTSAEFQQVKTEVVNSDFDNVFITTVATLRNQGFHVNVIDRSDGQISAAYRFTRDRQPEGEFFKGYRNQLASALRADVIVRSVDEYETFIDLTLVEEIPPPATGYNHRLGEISTRELRTARQYEIMFEQIKIGLKNNETQFSGSP
jgi:hypothetical protein